MSSPLLLFGRFLGSLLPTFMGSCLSVGAFADLKFGCAAVGIFIGTLFSARWSEAYLYCSPFYIIGINSRMHSIAFFNLKQIWETAVSQRAKGGGGEKAGNFAFNLKRCCLPRRERRQSFRPRDTLCFWENVGIGLGAFSATSAAGDASDGRSFALCTTPTPPKIASLKYRMENFLTVIITEERKTPWEKGDSLVSPPFSHHHRKMPARDE